MIIKNSLDWGFWKLIRDAHITSNALCINANGAMHNGSDMPFHVDAACCCLITTYTDAGRNEVPRV